jgi:hypothetical protein
LNRWTLEPWQQAVVAQAPTLLPYCYKALTATGMPGALPPWLAPLAVVFDRNGDGLHRRDKTECYGQVV